MAWIIRFSKRAENSVKNLEPEVSIRVISKIGKLESNPWALPYKKLRGHEDFYKSPPAILL